MILKLKTIISIGIAISLYVNLQCMENNKVSKEKVRQKDMCHICSNKIIGKWPEKTKLGNIILDFMSYTVTKIINGDTFDKPATPGVGIYQNI